ncbi:MAG: YraN family protein [Bacillota bacterium]
MTRQRQRIGQSGEKAALEYLNSRGFRIIQLNYRCPLGEVDIVARERETIVFVEVRTRTGGAMGRASESITRNKEKKLKRTALYYLQKEHGREMPCRIDCVAIEMDPENLTVLNIEHFRGILFG